MKAAQFKWKCHLRPACASIVKRKCWSHLWSKYIFIDTLLLIKSTAPSDGSYFTHYFRSHVYVVSQWELMVHMQRLLPPTQTESTWPEHSYPLCLHIHTRLLSIYLHRLLPIKGMMFFYLVRHILSTLPHTFKYFKPVLANVHVQYHSECLHKLPYIKYIPWNMHTVLMWLYHQ